ncbi:MAG: low-complexity tail membrane protein [Cyanobium sp. ELA507]
MAAPSARSEPLLWLQLLGLGVMPLEALLLMLLLAGSDPGPLPQLERLLCWAIGSVAPAFLLWKRPADVWSLLLVQAPLRGRREPQQRLSSLQGTPLLRAGLVVGSGLSLALLWWIDRHAALASAFSPLEGGARLVALLLAAAVLALLLWQWQQLLQALWLLSRSPAQLAAAPPMDQAAVAEQRLSLGIPLLLLNPLQPEANAPSPVRSARSAASSPVTSPVTSAASSPISSAARSPTTAPPSATASSTATTPSPSPTTASSEAVGEAPGGAQTVIDRTQAPTVADPPRRPASPAAPPTPASSEADGEATGGGQTTAEAPVRAPKVPIGEPQEEVKPCSDLPGDPEPPLVEAEILDPPSGGGAAVAVEPEQGSTDQQGTNLDQPIR